MVATSANGITIEYETFGEPADPTILLVMGLGGQLLSWPVGFCEQLAAEGFHVVRYDNRDVGLSTKLPAGSGYLLTDMADDAAGLLDALGVDAAHVVGASMGGMIAQTLAIHHPERVHSLCSIMSTTGAPATVAPTPDMIDILTRPPATNRDDAIAFAVEAAVAIGSTAFETSDEARRAKAAEAYDRCFFPAGIGRQIVAVASSGDRTEALASVKVPTLVIHGSVDPLVTPLGGELTAAAVPGAELMVIEGMGHELPEQVWPQVVERIVANIARAR